MSQLSFTVYTYKSEIDFLKSLVKRKEDIETGGDLFGLWIDGDNLVVQLVSGPGQNCRRTATSFFQDVKYLTSIGTHLTANEGLCNVGEWHSHHRLGLAKPSFGDEQTVWRSMPEGLIKFVVFIANISGSKKAASVNVGCFLFDRNTMRVVTGEFKFLSEDCSPLRKNPRVTDVLKNGAEKDGNDSNRENRKRKKPRITKEGKTNKHTEHNVGSSHEEVSKLNVNKTDRGKQKKNSDDLKNERKTKQRTEKVSENGPKDMESNEDSKEEEESENCDVKVNDSKAMKGNNVAIKVCVNDQKQNGMIVGEEKGELNKGSEVENGEEEQEERNENVGVGEKTNTKVEKNQHGDVGSEKIRKEPPVKEINLGADESLEKEIPTEKEEIAENNQKSDQKKDELNKFRSPRHQGPRKRKKKPPTKTKKNLKNK